MTKVRILAAALLLLASMAAAAAEDTDEPRRRVSFATGRIRVVVNGTIALE